MNIDEMVYLIIHEFLNMCVYIRVFKCMYVGTRLCIYKHIDTHWHMQGMVARVNRRTVSGVYPCIPPCLSKGLWFAAVYSRLSG